MLEYRESGGRGIVEINDDMTIYNASELRKGLLPLLKKPLDLVIDLHGVRDIDSAGIQLLVLAKRTRAAGNLKLSLEGHSECVMNALETLGLVAYFGDPVVILKAQETHDES